MPTIEARVLKLERKQSNPKFVKATLDHPEVKAIESQWEEKIAILKKLWESGEVAIIEYSESVRHDDASGRDFTNRYFEGVKTKELEPEPQTALDIPLEPQQAGRPTDPATAWRISLAAGAKLAIATLPFLEEHERSVDEQRTLAAYWGLFLYETTYEMAKAEIGGFEPIGVSTGDGDDIPF